jgi:hypothetical protein
VFVSAFASIVQADVLFLSDFTFDFTLGAWGAFVHHLHFSKMFIL